jgi:hypothetical protein
MMRIDDGYPSPSKLKKNELETLQYIKDSIIFHSYYATLANDASTNYFQLQNASSLKFISQMDICFDQRSRRIGNAYIGLDIGSRDDQYSQVSYTLAICSKDRSRHRLLRKFHFDYALPGVPSRQPHPVFHLQYAGGLFGPLRDLNIQHAHLDAWLSEPRLSFMPMSLALLINIVFKEFPDENAIKVIERAEWRELIRKNEKFLLVPYFKCCHNFMNALNDLGKLLTNDFYYGK